MAASGVCCIVCSLVRSIRCLHVDLGRYAEPMVWDGRNIPRDGWIYIGPKRLIVGKRKIDLDQALAAVGHMPFGVIYPDLHKLGNQSIDVDVLSPRLVGILRRWKGLFWDPYVEQTPIAFLRRSGAGKLTLLDFMDAAAAEVGGSAADLPELAGLPDLSR